MDHKNGVFNHLAPPRPPKSIPRVHRPRAPDPTQRDTVDSSTPITASTAHPSYPPLPIAASRMSRSGQVASNSSDPLNQAISHHRTIPSIPPVTAPLTPLQSVRSTALNSSTASSAVSTFSRRRTETTPPQRAAALSSGSNTNLVTRSLAPSSIVAPTANLIQNAINAVVRRSVSPINSSSSNNNNNNNVNSSSNSNSVTLQIPRPETDRLPNEYVDTPFASHLSGKALTAPGSRHSLATATVSNRNQLLLVNGGHTNISIIDGTGALGGGSINNNNNNQNENMMMNNSNSNISSNNNNNVNSSNVNNSSNSTSNKVNLPNPVVQRPNLLPITKQPSLRSTNTLSKKDVSPLHHQSFSHCPVDSEIIAANNNNNNGFAVGAASDQLNSITCPQCNRCRCEECQRPRQLPYKWICNDNFLCSAETIIDYASCLCCVKGLYYHCAKDHEIDCDSETIRCAEDPCSCAPYKRVSRWGCLGALSLLLPCLLCYWPMRACVGLCAKCYAKHSRHGCRCNSGASANNSHLNIINLASATGQDQIHHYHRQSNINDLTPEKRLLDSSHSEY